MKKKMTLSNAWYEACLKLWDLANKYNYKSDDATLWDAFKLLYLESVPDSIESGAGRKAKGVINGITD